MGHNFTSDPRYQTDHSESPVIAEKDRRIAELEAALRPFSDAAALYDGIPPSTHYGDTSCELRYSSSTKHEVTVAKLRAARKALTKSNF